MRVKTANVYLVFSEIVSFRWQTNQLFRVSIN